MTPLKDVQRLYPSARFDVSVRPLRDAITALVARGRYVEWEAVDSVKFLSAVPRNLVLHYLPCPDDPTEEERRLQIKRGRERALARQRRHLDALDTFLFGVERILDEAGFEGVAKALRPRFVSLADDHDAPLLPVKYQKRSCCSPRSSNAWCRPINRTTVKRKKTLPLFVDIARVRPHHIKRGKLSR